MLQSRIYLMIIYKTAGMLIRTGLLVALAAGSVAAAEDGFKSVTGPCALSFPADHGPHPEYRTEWWYYTGNLTAADDRRFGFQLTFFRSGLQPPEKRQDWPPQASAWRSDQIYLAHAAITDIANGRHLQAERMSRPVLSLAGAEQTPATVRVHVHDWQTVITPQNHRLQADADDFSLRLDLTPGKPPVLHGDNAYSLKGQSPERASCYYSFTRLQAAGSLMVNGNQHSVQGLAWMDHEFSTAPLQPGISGWDWFSLQLADQTEIMFFRLRESDGSVNPASSGTLVFPSGEWQHLKNTDLHLTPLSYWTSPHSGARYPIAWHLRSKTLQLELTLTARVKDQEMRTPRTTQVSYWEGSLEARGTRRGESIDGIGYLELTGYAEPFDAPL
jgi:predicted secreted hydrolase